MWYYSSRKSIKSLNEEGVNPLTAEEICPVTGLCAGYPQESHSKSCAGAVTGSGDLLYDQEGKDGCTGSKSMDIPMAEIPLQKGLMHTKQRRERRGV
ncbi:hypothetical protein FKM82_005033 [Ascaphus truei]